MESLCRAFYIELLGMQEIVKPPGLAARGGLWVRLEGLEIHLGVEDDFRPARKAHPGIVLDNHDDLDKLAEQLAVAGRSVIWDDNFPGFRRFYTADPVGNRLEFMQPIE